MVGPWDPDRWLERFRQASLRRDRAELRRLRCEVFDSTVEAIRAGGYSVDGGWIALHAPDERDPLLVGTGFHPRTDTLEVPEVRRGIYSTRIEVLDADCLDVARCLGRSGEAPAVLNMASRHNPGGGVARGAGAQEENLFRRSELLRSLYQFVPYGREYGVPEDPDGHRYPIPRDSGGIYTPPAMVLRSSEDTGYAFLADPFRAAFVTVPAIRDPEVRLAGGELRLTDAMAEAMRPKIRAIFRLASRHDHADLVLSAFGCGAFRNPPRHVARLFRETLAEPEFAGVFRRVVFAVVDDHNARRRHNPEGNLHPFREELDSGARLGSPHLDATQRPLFR